MTTILKIDASARRERSLTRMMSELFVKTWLDAEPTAKIIHRDVGANPPFVISESWIAAAFNEPTKRTSEEASLLELSDQLIDEVEEANVLLIATPMYNYGMPAALKAWVDQVVRVGKTFTFDLARGDRPLEPTLSGKTLVLTTAAGEFGFGLGEINEGAGHLVPHIATVSKYLGVDEMRHVAIEYQEFGDHRFETSKADALCAIPRLVESMLTLS